MDKVVVQDGVPVVGDGVPVAQLMALWRSGIDIVDIPQHVPAVTANQVAAALRYYGEKMAEFD